MGLLIARVSLSTPSPACTQRVSKFHDGFSLSIMVRLLIQDIFFGYKSSSFFIYQGRVNLKEISFSKRNYLFDKLHTSCNVLLKQEAFSFFTTYYYISNFIRESLYSIRISIQSLVFSNHYISLGLIILEAKGSGTPVASLSV